MQTWSDQPVSNFKVKFYLDTNILSYILDNTYSGVTDTIKILGQLPFVDLVSSRFVVFELAGIRKREHYLREMVKTQSGTGTLNMSSLLKYKDGYSAPELEFSLIKDQIKQKVEQELQTIVNIHYIDYKGNTLHDELLEPTVELCLSSKISKEDSLVLVSALLPVKQKPESDVSLITKDKQFSEAYDEFQLQPFLNSYTLCKPDVEYIKGIALADGTNVNLTHPSDDARLPGFWVEKIKEMLIKKNAHLFLGKTFPPHSPGNLPPHCICFKLNANTNLPNNIIVTFISKTLDFIYSIRISVKDFWNTTSIKAYPFVANQVVNISFLAFDADANNEPIPIPANIVSTLREDGHLVFIHPDSFNGS
jgi:hypothetical protein